MVAVDRYEEFIVKMMFPVDFFGFLSLKVAGHTKKSYFCMLKLKCLCDHSDICLYF